MAEASMAKTQQHSVNSGNTRTGERTQQHAKGSGIPDVSERLYSNVHVCNHARCAANNPNYNVKAVTPPKKFLVAKKHSYGGPEKTKSSTLSDQDRSHALHSLTNSVLQPKNGKVTSKGLVSKGRNGDEDRELHNRISDTKVAERRLKPTSSTFSRVQKPTSSSSAKARTGSSGHSSVTTESQSVPHSRLQQKSRLGTASSLASQTATEGTQWEESSSPKSSITSISITQIISRRRGGEEDEQAAAVASSPTASVGSNHDTATTGLKETVSALEGKIFDQSFELTPGVSDLHSPASETASSNLQKGSVTGETTYGSPTPSVSSRPVVLESLTLSITSNPSRSSATFVSTTPERSSHTTPASEYPSPSLQTTSLGEATTYDSPTPSVASRPSASESLTSTVSSDTARPSPSSASTSPGRSSLTTPPASASQIGTNLKESSKAGSAVSSSWAASAKKPSKISKTTSVDSSSSIAASRLAKKFISDLQAGTAGRRAASTKGVRSIELRGGKAQSYSKTTVTSWNVTTTTVETSPSVSQSENTAGSGLSRAGSAPAFIKPPWQSNTKEVAKLARDGSTGRKFANRARSRTVFDDVQDESETVSLKHGEVVERRLSEEWMTDHALEGAVKKIADNDHRVKVLVHAYESLATFSDSEGAHGSEDNSSNTQLEYEVLSATPITA